MAPLLAVALSSISFIAPPQALDAALPATGGFWAPHASEVFVMPAGKWTLTAVKWHHWGRSTATATGNSVVSRCARACNTGPFVSARMRLTVSRPGTFAGRRVYTCFRLTASNSPTKARGCLHKAAGAWRFM